LGQKRGLKNSLGRGRGCVFGSSPKQLEWPHPELMHWWLLVHSSHNPVPPDRTGCHNTGLETFPQPIPLHIKTHRKLHSVF